VIIKGYGERDGHPVTKNELQVILQTALTAQKDELIQKMRDIETNLLTSFHGYGRGIQARMHSLESGGVDVNIRLAAIEDRLLALESRRPPSV